LVTINQLAISTGVAVAYYVDYRLAAGGNWRWMFMSALVPSLLLLGGLLFLPETPRWLATRGRFSDAERVLRQIEGPREVARDLEELRRVTESDNLKLKDLLTRRFAKPLAVGIGLAIFQQVTGVNTIVYYAPTIFQSVGFSSAAHAILATFLIGSVGLSFTIVAMLLLDKVGRRPLLLVSIAGMGLVLLHLALLLGTPHPSKFLIVTDVLVYLAAFNIGLGPVFWLLISEIYPTTVRAQAVSLATVAVWAGDRGSPWSKGQFSAVCLLVSGGIHIFLANGARDSKANARGNRIFLGHGEPLNRNLFLNGHGRSAWLQNPGDLEAPEVGFSEQPDGADARA
jgi:sugar porter (SP) family MFS transporter